MMTTSLFEPRQPVNAGGHTTKRALPHFRDARARALSPQAVSTAYKH
jgi:hypothetical protein